MRTSGYVGIVDGPWACYVCAVFGNTAEGWQKHHDEKHPSRIEGVALPSPVMIHGTWSNQLTYAGGYD